MKIISKFKDYYDGAAALGIDNNLIYYRKTELADLKTLNEYDSFIRDRPDTFELERINIDTSNYYTANHYINFEEVIIGFCGKLYPAFQFKIFNEKINLKTSVFYRAENVDRFFRELESKYKKFDLRQHV